MWKESLRTVNRQHRIHKEQTAKEKWIDLKGVLLTTAEEVCGTSKGGKKINKETWRWSEEVQTSIKKKKEAFKNWQREDTDQLKEVFKEKKKRKRKELLRKLKRRATRSGTKFLTLVRERRRFTGLQSRGQRQKET